MLVDRKALSSHLGKGTRSGLLFKRTCKWISSQGTLTSGLFSMPKMKFYLPILPHLFHMLIWIACDGLGCWLVFNVMVLNNFQKLHFLVCVPSVWSFLVNFEPFLSLRVLLMSWLRGLYIDIFIFSFDFIFNLMIA